MGNIRSFLNKVMQSQGVERKKAKYKGEFTYDLSEKIKHILDLRTRKALNQLRHRKRLGLARG